MTLLELFQMRKWIEPATMEQLERKADEIGKMINGLIRAIS